MKGGGGGCGRGGGGSGGAGAGAGGGCPDRVKNSERFPNRAGNSCVSVSTPGGNEGSSSGDDSGQQFAIEKIAVMEIKDLVIAQGVGQHDGDRARARGA